MLFVDARQRWDEGARRLNRAEPGERALLERVTEHIALELRRRLGGPFTTDELALLYGRGTDWCLDIAVKEAPRNPRAWDVEVVGDAAFARYAREAIDFGGGRRMSE